MLPGCLHSLVDTVAPAIQRLLAGDGRRAE